MKPCEIVTDADGRRVARVVLSELSEHAQQVVGVDFNPSGEAQIDLIKGLAAGLVHLGIKGYESSPKGSLQSRAFEDGVRMIEAGAMFLVKAIVHRSKGR